MIASLRGRLTSEDLDGIVIEVGGVGLRVHASSAAAGLARQSPELVALQTELIVREDALTLYGFADLDERDLFNLLRGVTGVGPRIALAILSLHRPATVRRAIVDGDIAQLTRVSGVGRKLAERLALELRERVGTPGPVAVEDSGGGDGEYAAAREALVALGFSVAQADEGLSETSGDANDRLRAALALLGAAR
jgi:Holliday junction DNA helicase RuvA